jgi:hypothetical protein
MRIWLHITEKCGYEGILGVLYLGKCYFIVIFGGKIFDNNVVKVICDDACGRHNAGFRAY